MWCYFTPNTKAGEHRPHRHDKKIEEFREKRFCRFIKSETGPSIDSKLLEDTLFKELFAEGLRIQHRFVAALVYAKTGKGYFKSEGVEELQRIKDKTLKPG